MSRRVTRRRAASPFFHRRTRPPHEAIPLGTRLLVGYGGDSTVATVDDRGPFTDGRDLDLSQGAAETIGLTEPGVAPVDVEILPQ
jgi:rare lipoprotein A